YTGLHFFIYPIITWNLYYCRDCKFFDNSLISTAKEQGAYKKRYGKTGKIRQQAGSKDVTGILIPYGAQVYAYGIKGCFSRAHHGGCSTAYKGIGPVCS